MKKTTTPLQTPSPDSGKSQLASEVGSGNNPLVEFFSATLTMSWHLAVAVLVPILGGFALDRRLHTQPILTIVGFVLALGGTSAIIWQQYRIISSLPKGHSKGHRP